MKAVLITGGAGFIGSHLAEELLEHGYRVRVLDVLEPQVHEEGSFPADLKNQCDLVHADVRDPEAVARALRGMDAVVHLAAAVGVGQSMYQLHKYVSINTLGTAVLLEALAAQPVARLVVASSMSVYGEGAYRNGDGRTLRHLCHRDRGQLERHEWDLRGDDGRPLEAIPTPEGLVPLPSSPYALTKYDQELLCLMWGLAYRIPSVALRLFNVYGPGQALSNPYTGVMAIFACRLLNGSPPLIYEDGRQRRDFVHVRDVARAFRLALERPQATGRVINIGSGSAVTIAEVARLLGESLEREDLEPEITGKYRFGDVRHCYADVSCAAELLGYRAEVDLAAGIHELSGWLANQQAVDRAPLAAAELNRRGLTL